MTSEDGDADDVARDEQKKDCGSRLLGGHDQGEDRHGHCCDARERGLGEPDDHRSQCQRSEYGPLQMAEFGGKLHPATLAPKVGVRLCSGWWGLSTGLVGMFVNVVIGVS